jgi:hypothetical protein
MTRRLWETIAMPDFALIATVAIFIATAIGLLITVFLIALIHRGEFFTSDRLEKWQCRRSAAH